MESGYLQELGPGEIPQNRVQIQGTTVVLKQRVKMLQQTLNDASVLSVEDIHRLAKYCLEDEDSEDIEKVVEMFEVLIEWKNEKGGEATMKNLVDVFATNGFNYVAAKLQQFSRENVLSKERKKNYRDLQADNEQDRTDRFAELPSNANPASDTNQTHTHEPSADKPGSSKSKPKRSTPATEATKPSADSSPAGRRNLKRKRTQIYKNLGGMVEKQSKPTKIPVWKKTKIAKTVKTSKTLSLVKIAEKYQVSWTTIQEISKNLKNPNWVPAPAKPAHQTFTNETEKEILKQIKDVVKAGGKITRLNVRKIGYKFAVEQKKCVNKPTVENKMLSNIWCQGFLKRQKEVAKLISQPETLDLKQYDWIPFKSEQFL